MSEYLPHVYIGLGGEGEYIGQGGLYRKSHDNEDWDPILSGLGKNPQVRALLIHPNDPSIIYAGTDKGPFRSDDRGDHWEAMGAPESDVWSLAFHPSNPDIIYAGYEPCAVYKTVDAGNTWYKTNTDQVSFPHITTYMPPLAKRVIGIASDPSSPDDVYGAIEVGGLIASRDGGESWEQLLDGP